MALPTHLVGTAAMQRIKVLSIQRISAEDRAKIEAVDPAIQLTDAGGWYEGQFRETWPAFASARYLAPRATGSGTQEERDRLLAQAEVILGGWPFPLDLRVRAPRLKWFHQCPAGASNLRMGDLWGSSVMVTTSRGAGNTLAVAEYVVAGILHFATRGLLRGLCMGEPGVFPTGNQRVLLVEISWTRISRIVGLAPAVPAKPGILVSRLGPMQRVRQLASRKCLLKGPAECNSPPFESSNIATLRTQD
jgi:hypothetical protein